MERRIVLELGDAVSDEHCIATTLKSGCCSYLRQPDGVLAGKHRNREWHCAIFGSLEGQTSRLVRHPRCIAAEVGDD